MKIQTFCKRPVKIQAVQLTHENQLEVGNWCSGICRYDEGVEIETLEGWMTARIGDWIIQGIKGEFYPCKNDIFLLTYE